MFNSRKKEIISFIQVLLIGSSVLSASAYLLFPNQTSAIMLLDGDPTHDTATCASLSFRAIPSSIPANTSTAVQFNWTQRQSNLLTSATITNQNTNLPVWSWVAGGTPFTSSPTVNLSISANTIFQLDVAGSCTETTPIDVLISATAPFCGNGIIEGTEQCDNGALNGTCPASCSATCKLNPVCTSSSFDQGTGVINVSSTSAGTYSIPIIFFGVDSGPTAVKSQSTATINATITGPPTGAITLIPTSYTFNAIAGGANPPSIKFRVSNSGGAGTTLNWTAASDQAWLLLASANGTTPAGTLTIDQVSVDITGLAPKVYTGHITVSDPAASNNPQVATITLDLTGAATIQVNSENFKTGAPVHSSWSFPALPTPTDPCTMTGSPGCTNLSSATYNSVPVPNDPDTYTLQANTLTPPTNYSLGGVRKEIVYSPPESKSFSLIDTLKDFFVSIARAVSVQNCSVPFDPLCTPSNLDIFPQPLKSAGTAIFWIDWYPEAQIQVAPSSVSFTDTSPGTVNISNVGAPGSSMNWNVASITYTSGSNWLNVLPNSGGPVNQGGPGQSVTLSYKTSANLVQGTYSAVVRFFASSTAPGTGFSQQDVPVTLTMTTPPVSCSPDGYWINTAANGGSVTLHATGGTGSYNWTAPGGTPPSGGPGSDFTVNYPSTNTYTVDVTSPPGKPTACTVNVLDLSCTFSAKPTKIIAPEISKLSWTCINASRCDIASDKGDSYPGVNPVTGTQPVTPTSTTNYYLNCKGGPTLTVTYSTTVQVEVAKPAIKEP